MILPGTRRPPIAFGTLTLLAFVVLFGGAAATDRYFAWTIKPPATAAFLGAVYAAGSCWSSSGCGGVVGWPCGPRSSPS